MHNQLKQVFFTKIQTITGKKQIKKEHKMNLKGSKTEENLKKAFEGESMARNKYLIFSENARKNGFIQISRIFQETAENEAMHGKIWLKYLMGKKFDSTLDNLIAAAEAEHYEWTQMYAEFAQTAKDEGFDEIAYHFDKIRNIEEMHDTRYTKLIADIKQENLFNKSEKVIWECAKCGYTHTSEKAPEVCPFCKHPQGYFFIKCFNY